MRLAELLSAFLLLDVVEIAEATGSDPKAVAELHYAASDRLRVDEMLTRVTKLPRDDRWSTLARAAARHDVYAALSAITTAVLRDDRRRAWTPTPRIEAWAEAQRRAGGAGRPTVRRRARPGRRPIWPRVSVALRTLRSLAG